MYEVVRRVARLLVDSFFREVTVVGMERIPVAGPVIFVGNHNNQFIDASIIMSMIPRKQRFLIATVSLNLRVVGRLATWAGAIGVNRAQDMKYPGMGRIIGASSLADWPFEKNFQSRQSCDMSGEPRKTDTRTILIGDSLTRFRLDVKKGDKLKIDGYPSLVSVAEVPDDKHIIIKESIWENLEEGTSSGKKLKLLKFPNMKMSDSSEETQMATPISRGNSTIDKDESKGAFGFTIYPKVDQGDIYEAVCKALYEGDCITVFPEGGSHDQPGLLPLKPGVAIMALNAALMGIEDVMIIPVGFHYFERHKFGSKAVVEIGEPLPIAKYLVDMYAGDEKRRATALLMADVKEAMENCMISAPDFETMKAIELCAALYPPERTRLATEKKHQLHSLFTHMFNYFQHDPETVKLKDAVLLYGSQLEANGIEDHEVPHMKVNAERAMFNLATRVLLLIVVCVISLPALILSAPIKATLKVMTERHRRSAKARSSVKVTGVDVVASYKIIWSIVFMPVVFISIGLYVGYKWTQSILGMVLSLVAAITLLPYASYYSLRLQSQIKPLLRQIRCLYRVIISELDVWREGEREVILDRIDVQLKVRAYVKSVLEEGTMHKAMSSNALLSLNGISREDQDDPHSPDSALTSSLAKSRKLRDLQTDLERIIPLVLLDADTRRLLRSKESYIPLVYRSALASREEIL